MITTYSELKSAIADFLNRDDLTAVIPAFVSMAEAAIDRDIRHWRQERRVTGTIDNRYEQLPPDFLEARSVLLSDGTTLMYAPDVEIARMRGRTDTAGTPQLFTYSAGQFEFFPDPAEPQGVVILYYANIPNLSDANPSNWLLEQNPDVYLYGSLIHSSPYLKDDQRATVWGALYAAAVANLNRTSTRAMSSGGRLVMRTRT
jgi:hypothetical protein